MTLTIKELQKIQDDADAQVLGKLIELATEMSDVITEAKQTTELHSSDEYVRAIGNIENNRMAIHQVAEQGLRVLRPIVLPSMHPVPIGSVVISQEEYEALKALKAASVE